MIILGNLLFRGLCTGGKGAGIVGSNDLL
jgi:hypothetical protein